LYDKYLFVIFDFERTELNLIKEKNMVTAYRTLKERLRNKATVLGTWNSIPSTSLADVMGSSGIDFIVIDAEHGPVSMEKAEDIIRAIEASGSTPIIRVPSNEDHLILRALDIGACGVQIPHISTREEAERAVKSVKYYPKGKRGLSPFTRAGNYGADAEGYTDRANEKTMVVLNIEGREGMENIEQIASVPGIDVIFVGPYDLSQSMGMPGNVNDKKVLEAILHCVNIADREGIACGSFACDREYLNLLAKSGVRYITYMVDASVIAGAYKDICGFFKECIKKEKI
jgi:4-hydroxy-2-oxoheptanedioate aldolase